MDAGAFGRSRPAADASREVGSVGCLLVEISCRVIGGPYDPTSQNDARRTQASSLRSTYQGRKSCDIAAFMLGWLIEKGSVRFGSQACGVLGSFFEYAFAWTPS